MESAALRYRDKTVLITGGGNGIGRGCAEVFARNGAKVVICDIDETEGHRVEAACNACGQEDALFLRCDVTSEENIKNTVEATLSKYGRIDCLINNAGVHPLPQTIDETSADDFRNILNMNVISYFLMAKYCLPHLRKNKGSIINVASLVAEMGQPTAVTYVSTKGAIRAMTKALAIDEAKHDVRVNSISPGNILTPMWTNFAATRVDGDRILQQGAECQLNGRFGTPEECGLACLYLAADATFCTGIDMNMSGGAELTYGRKTQMDD